MLVNRLHTDKDLLHKYDEIIQQQVKNSIIEEVDVTNPECIICHIILFLLQTRKLQKYAFFTMPQPRIKALQVV